MAVGLARLVKSDPVDEIDKTWVCANWIKEWKHLQDLQYVGLFFVALLKPDKCLVVFTQSKVGEYKCSRGNVFGLSTSIQFSQQPKCVRASASLGASVHKKANHCWAIVGSRDAFFQHWDRVLRRQVPSRAEP